MDKTLLSQIREILGLTKFFLHVAIKSMRPPISKVLPNPSVLSVVVAPPRSMHALYTCKAVILLKPCTCEKLGFSDDPKICEKQTYDLCASLSRIIEEPDVHGFLSKASKILEQVRDEDVKKSLLHEISHAYIAKNTYALTLAEMSAWRVRFNLMYLMEKFYGVVGRQLAKELEKRGFKIHPEFRIVNGFPGLDDSDTREVIHKISPSLRELAAMREVVRALRDGYQHNLFLRGVIHPILAPIVEVVTWYVMGENLEEMYEYYISESVFDENLHGPIVEELIDVLEARKPSIEKVVKASRIALDFTPDEYSEFRDKISSISGPRDDQRRVIASEVKNLVVERFKATLDNKHVARAPTKLKSLGRILLYAIPSELPGFIETFSRIILSEEELWRHPFEINNVLNMPAGSYTAVYIDILINGERKTIGYNSLSQFFGRNIKRTGTRLTSLELIVGDLVLALRGFLTASYLVTSYNKRGEELKKLIGDLREYLPMEGISEKKLNDVFNEVLSKGEAFKKLLYNESSKYALDVLEAFTYAVLILGSGIKVFGGPHGLWYL